MLERAGRRVNTAGNRVGSRAERERCRLPRCRRAARNRECAGCRAVRRYHNVGRASAPFGKRDRAGIRSCVARRRGQTDAPAAKQVVVVVVAPTATGKEREAGETRGKRGDAGNRYAIHGLLVAFLDYCIGRGTESRAAWENQEMFLASRRRSTAIESAIIGRTKSADVDASGTTAGAANVIPATPCDAPCATL